MACVHNTLSASQKSSGSPSKPGKKVQDSFIIIRLFVLCAIPTFLACWPSSSWSLLASWSLNGYHITRKQVSSRKELEKEKAPAIQASIALAISVIWPWLTARKMRTSMYYLFICCALTESCCRRPIVCFPAAQQLRPEKIHTETLLIK